MRLLQLEKMGEINGVEDMEQILNRLMENECCNDLRFMREIFTYQLSFLSR